VVWTYSGVRPLCDDESDSPQAITRDYTLDIHDVDGQAPLLFVFGGKLTTYRKLAEHALEKLAPYYKGIGPAWTKGAVLPGGDIGDTAMITPRSCAVASRSSPKGWRATMPAPTAAIPS
jgi:glycerol-3-phosphate dehydrogenase